MSSWHIGLSVVATDVGGGFSIGLGGLGFTMGFLVHGCYSRDYWRLVECRLIIPKVSHLGHKYKFFTFPQIFGHFYDGRVALLAGIILCDWICRFY
jgi:SSS family solute:Na+ symporter